MELKNANGDLSYSQNEATFMGSSLSCITKPLVERAIESILKRQELKSHKHLTIAVLGCATIEVLSTVIELTMAYMEVSDDNSAVEMLVYLNDLPSNDFNSLFKDMSIFQRRFEDIDGVKLILAGVPGSFYGGLFPKTSLHFVHSCYTAHCLSQAPPELYIGEGSPMNKGNVYISETSPPHVAEAYWSQFVKDFTKFLSCRSEEVLAEGRVLLTLRGRPSDVDGNTWQPYELKLFTQAATRLISKGLMNKEKLDSFDFPFFGASREDIKLVVDTQGSFEIEHVETMKQNVGNEYEHDKHLRADNISKIIRSYTESLVVNHFGSEILDPLYNELVHVTFQFLADASPEHFTIAVLLVRSTSQSA